MNNKPKILIIEDDVDLIEATKVMLNDEQYSILTALHPDDGMQMALETLPDLIILDVMFGREQKVEGFDYAVKMKQDPSLAPAWVARGCLRLLDGDAAAAEGPGSGRQGAGRSAGERESLGVDAQQTARAGSAGQCLACRSWPNC